jgi:hypothetical protein
VTHCADELTVKRFVLQISDGAADAGEPVVVSDVELEDDGSSMSRVIQLNITGPTQDVKLTLTRNDRIPMNITVLVGHSGGRVSSFVNPDNEQVNKPQTRQRVFRERIFPAGCVRIKQNMCNVLTQMHSAPF